MILGTLGRLVWYRCDACGMDYNRPLDAHDHDPRCPMCGADADPYGEEAERVYWDDDDDSDDDEAFIPAQACA